MSLKVLLAMMVLLDPYFIDMQRKEDVLHIFLDV
jgi:hypothetical protein